MNKRNLQSKRALRSVLLVLLLSVVGLTKAFATYDFSAVCETGQTLYYNITDATNHYVELTCPGSNSWNGFAKPTGNIILPENVQYNGVNYTVTSIGNYAFYYCQGLTDSLTIPNPVTTIGNYAFYYCSGLTSVTIGNSVTSIGDVAFNACDGLNAVYYLGDISQWCNIQFGSNNYYSGHGTNPLTIAHNLYIDNELVTDLVIPNTVTEIKNSAFEYATCLTSLTIGNSVNSIGYFAFASCTGLTSIAVGNSVVSVSDFAFYYCGDLEQIVVESGNTVYDSRESCNAIIETATNTLIVGCKNTVIPYSVTAIGLSAFEGCSGLTGSLTIPESVTTIGDWAFDRCSELNAIVLPSSIVSIGDAFNDCNGLTAVYYTGDISQWCNIEFAYTSLPIIWDDFLIRNGGVIMGEGVSNPLCYAHNLYIGNELVTDLVIPETVTEIKSWSFINATCLTSLTIGNSVTSIGQSAFESCSGLTSIEIPNSVTSIGEFAFSGCSGLTSITVFAETPPSLDNNVFYNVNKSIPVYVPCGALDAYQNAVGWNEFTNYQEILPYELFVSSSNTEMGAASIVQEPDCGVNAVVQAVPIGDYHFFNWTENGEIISTDATYSFTLESDRNLVANFGESTNYWTPNENDYEDNMTLTCIVQIDGVEQATNVLELGAFCGEECRGTQMATYFAPTNRYIYQMMVFGESNDVISFRLYDHLLQQELLLSPPADVTFNTNGYGSLTNPYVLNFTSTVTHAQALNSGWNWWSTYIELNNNDGLSQLENSIGSNGLVIKSRTNGYVEAYDDNGVTIWYGTLNSINNEQMYKIRTNAACEATVMGVPAVPENHPISINSGWNWIGFPCNQDVSVDVAMSNFTPENNDVIKGRTGFTTYYSDNNYNMWYGTLNTLEVGKGYMYRSNSTTQKTLVFQTGRGETTMENVTTEDNIFQPADGDFADNMTITAVLELDGEELQSEEYELAAFVGDECRGSVKLMYVEPVNRYVAFLTVFGEPSETLYFRLTDGTQTEMSMDEITFAADGMEGTLSEPMTLHFGTTKLDENEWSKVLVYPNPSNGVFNIQGQGIRKIEVFNAFGQAVVSEETGNDHLQIDLSRYADGCYMLRVVTDNGISNRQLIKK